jgi:hypothetical protein
MSSATTYTPLDRTNFGLVAGGLSIGFILRVSFNVKISFECSSLKYGDEFLDGYHDAMIVWNHLGMSQSERN